MRVLGVDPGTVATGWGIVEESGQRARWIASGVIRARGSLPARLGRIHAQLREIAEAHSPVAISLEKTFVSANVQSAFRLGEARGAALVAAAQLGLEVFEYSPAEVKLAIVGYGRALKEQVQAMAGKLLELRHEPTADEADALAAAICHLHSRGLQGRLDAPLARRRRNRARSGGASRVTFLARGRGRS